MSSCPSFLQAEIWRQMSEDEQRAGHELVEESGLDAHRLRRVTEEVAMVRGQARELAQQAYAFKMRAEAAEATAAAQGARLTALNTQVRKLQGLVDRRRARTPVPEPPDLSTSPVDTVLDDLRATLRGAAPRSVSPTSAGTRTFELIEDEDTPPTAVPRAESYSPPSQTERRGARRSRLVSEVQMRRERDTWHGASHSVSETGMFVSSWDPPPVGAVVELTLPLPGETPVVVRARVQWHRTNSQGEASGCGLLFDDVDVDVAGRLARLAGSLYTE